MILQDLLLSAGVDIHPHHSRPNEINICCPFCPENGESEDVRYRLGINELTGRGQCFNCGWRSGGLMKTVHEIARIFGLKYSIRQVKRDAERIAADPPKQPEPVATGYPIEYEKFSTHPDEIESAALAYLQDRGVSVLQIHRHKIGFAGAGDLAWRVLFPVFGLDKRCYGCVGRDFSGKQKQKYMNTVGVKMLWGTEFEGSHAIICEGIMDALRVEQALLSTPSSVAVARLGSAITDIQLAQLKSFDLVTIMPDADQPGVAGAITLAQRTTAARIKTRVCIPADMSGKDPGSMDVQEILDALADSAPFSKATELRLRAAAAKK